MDYIKIDLKANDIDFRKKDELFRMVSIFFSVVFLLSGSILIFINGKIDNHSREQIKIKSQKKIIIAEENKKIEEELNKINEELNLLVFDNKNKEKINYILKKLSNFSLNEKLSYIEEVLSGTKSKLEIFNYDSSSIIIMIELDKNTNSKELLKKFEEKFEKVIIKEKETQKIRLELRW